MARIGLVAGEGKLPVVFSKLARENGDTVVAFCLKGVTSPELETHVEKAHWLDWGHLEKGLLLLATERLKKIIMLGKLDKKLFFNNADKLDDKAKSIISKLGDNKDYALLNEAKKFLGKLGVEVMDSTTYLKELMPSRGTLTARSPAGEESADIEYGIRVAKSLSGFDIGQSVAVKNKTVIAVEAVEGTDEMIKRAAPLASTGFVIVKVARPDQDMRFDVPLVGFSTVKTLADAGGTALALEAGRTILMDKNEVVELADERGISIVVV
jgi:UDP-2,3-diacylglucosamine hydrolase